MNETTLKMVKAHLQARMRKRMEENPEQLEENLIDAVCIDCIDFRLMLNAQKDMLFGAVKQEEGVVDKFLDQVVDELWKMIEEENSDEENGREQP